jgi:carboxylesterase type B
MKSTIIISTIVLITSNIIYSQSENYEVFYDLPYLSEELATNDSLQRLNLVLPNENDNPPILIWIGGGAWSYGDKNQEMDLAKKLASKGIAVASIGHRLSPAIWRDSALNTGIQHPQHIKDIAASVKWLFENADNYGFDRNNIFIGGYSSGGHLAALIGLDNKYLNQIDLSPGIFKGIIPISGTYDIVDYHNVFLNGNRPELAKLHVEAVFGDSTKYFIDASPTNYLDNLSSPMLLICDNNLYNYTKLFEERIRETDFRNVQVVYAYNLSHGELWKNLSFSDTSVYRKIILDFIESNVKRG